MLERRQKKLYNKIMSESGKKTEENRTRDEKGHYKEGNSGGPGRTEGSGISITTEIKRKLQEKPEGENKATYLDLLIKRILKKAVVEGDTQTIKQIWNYIDGLPKGTIDLEGEMTQNIKLGDDEKELLNKAIELAYPKGEDTE